MRYLFVWYGLIVDDGGGGLGSHLPDGPGKAILNLRANALANQ